MLSIKYYFKITSCKNFMVDFLWEAKKEKPVSWVYDAEHSKKIKIKFRVKNSLSSTSLQCKFLFFWLDPFLFGFRVPNIFTCLNLFKNKCIRFVSRIN